MERMTTSPILGKYSHHPFVRGIILVGILFWLALFVGALTGYPGSKFTYTLFSLVFLVMLASGFYRQVSYGYLFLVVFLWLGFWLKLTIHTIFEYPYGEPVGSFDGTAAAWDQVLWVAIVASIGVVLGRILYGFANRKSTILILEDEFKTPSWYSAIRRWVWIVVMVVAIGLAVVNAIYGIQQSGLVPRTILPWPLNAVIYWLLGTGLSMGIVTLLWWDISSRKNISLTVYAILTEAFFSTISLLSRAVYIFHAIPQFIALYKNRTAIVRFSRSKTILMAVIFVGLFTISLSAVSILRSYYYSNVPLDSNVSILRSYFYSNVPLDFNSAKGFIETIKGLRISSRFIVDRWIGIEGVMAVSSYPQKRSALFLSALTERPKIGKVTLYQKICNSHYQAMDMNKYQFASLPGAGAFIYYTGSLGAVFLGMLALVLVALFSERLVLSMTDNALLCSLYGMDAANAIAQLGVAPRQLLIHFFMVFCGLIFIWILQTRLVDNLLRKVGLYRATA